MTIEAQSIDEYLEKLPEDRRQVISRLLEICRANLPNGFEERMNYGMPSFVIPHSLFPPGYHVDPSLPLPFLSIASQKNYVALYHSAVYADAELKLWFEQRYAQSVPTKLDMGKSCIRLKKMETIPYELIAELCQKVTPKAYIEMYEQVRG